MKTLSQSQREWIGRARDRLEALAKNEPGREFRRTVIRESGYGFALVSRATYEESCLESEYVGEIFAVKEKGEAVYSSFDQ